MKGNIEKYPVSKEKLFAELTRRGLTPSEASREMGVNADYLSNACGRGEMPKRAAIYLERIFRISPNDYAPDLLDALDKIETPENTSGGPLPNDARIEIAKTVARALVDEYRETFVQAFREAIVEGLKERGI